MATFAEQRKQAAARIKTQDQKDKVTLSKMAKEGTSFLGLGPDGLPKNPPKWGK